MTGTEVSPAVQEAIAVIDGGLRDLQQREIISANEVANLLLDLRLLLAANDLPVTDPVG